MVRSAEETIIGIPANAPGSVLTSGKEQAKLRRTKLVLVRELFACVCMLWCVLIGVSTGKQEPKLVEQILHHHVHAHFSVMQGF